MKIRHPGLIKATAFAVSWVARLWLGTLSYRYRLPEENVEPRRPIWRGQYIYTFWHENLLLPAYQYGRPEISVLVSQHADGELIAQICHHLGFRLVRGSSTRGGVPALRQMLRASRKGHLAITPDGPRGPRRQVQPGLVFLAARTGLPIVAMGFGYQHPWRFNTWDRFVLPRPGTLGTCVLADPIRVPAKANKDELENYRQQVEQTLHQVTEMAQCWAERQTWAKSSFVREDGPGIWTCTRNR